ncbi:hypothetical protein QTO34_001141 [Cnephaeus nilssonii]|uniref:Pantetheinase n=1 Tax=Cnephaeus nilssonii TaxID=3371016 RepID=A0AA40HVB5_CNENI|nr:hypothetical protein QTO34_001141 [Eptesicus nilssonii]
MITSSFQASVAVFALVILHVSTLDTFIAAVYEHAVLRPKATETPVSQDDALLLMNKNIDILEKAIKQAAEQGAQIIVTPEDALYGWKFTRETIFPYLEDIPDPQVDWIPCQDPHSGYYQYNTNVVYDAKGQLVARYHKYHLYSEPQFDVPEKPELVTFDTAFGRFGMFTCFDILFHDPAVTLVKDFQVDTILFPTAWMNVLPLLTAIEFHSAWAMGMRVNLLAANIHHVQQNMTVYEHAVILPNRTETPASKEEALLLMNKNIDVLEKAVKLAATQVFRFVYCLGYCKGNLKLEVFGYAPVQERLSCLAKDNSIYVVANIGDKKPCNASDPKCPPDGRYQYNTDVVFDSQGKLVARYHKFGIFTCFDIFSHDPAVVVVNEFQVDSVLYPTAWYNTLPLLSAVPFHSAWARAMGVNLLAANTHNTSMHMTGSGIYAPEAVKVYHYDMETESGQLMLSELKSRPRSEPTYPAPVDWSAYAKGIKPFLSEQLDFPGMIYFDEFTFTELKRNAGNYTVCQKDLCCHLTYKMSEKRTDEVYALGAFDGLHTVEGQYYLQSLDFSMITSQLLACAAISVFCVLKASSLDTFVAAVYEHAVILPNATLTPVPRELALGLMSRNLDLLEGAITSAAKQGAHIIVTPEDGLYGWNFNRESIYPYLEDIPDPQVNWIPCNHPNRFGHAPVQERLSCLAKENSIYVVANIGDKKPCNASDPQCPSDGRYQYNTDVVFDSQGKLVARYHKQNLFLGEDQFNVPKEPEVVTFDTAFGRFGMFTCFDILFHDPAVTLVKDFHVDTILFPTAWMNVLPHLSAIEFHSAWAMGMKVNFLASNIHHPSKKMTGSGIYAPDSPRAFHYDMKTEKGKLLLSQLDSHPKHPVVVNWTSYASGIEAFSTSNKEFKGTVFFDEYTFLELRGVTGNYTVCQKDLCCHLSYKMSEKRADEVYALGAFDGLHTVEGSYHLQICTLLKCKTTSLHTCGHSVETASTRFEMFSLSGTFGTPYVFPEVLLSEIQLAPGEFQVLRDGRLLSLKPPSGPVLTVTLFGRVYEKDHTSNASSDFMAYTLTVMLIVITPILYSLSFQ